MFPGEGSAQVFEWRKCDAPDDIAYSVWSPFRDDTTYFAPAEELFMINYRVSDLDAMLTQLKGAGARIVGGPEPHFNGRFAWVLDPEGRKIELWEPAAGH